MARSLKPLALYVHVPFCVQKCAYCDFASWPHRERDMEKYFNALYGEIARYRSSDRFGAIREDYRVRSVFFGGGTPTLAPAGYIAETLDELRALCPFDDDCEITVEGNPGTLTKDKLQTYRASGVNRLSLGAQSFDDGLLRALGRIHTADEIEKAVDMARDAGFENLSIDLMYALPGQSTQQWADTLERAAALKLKHISAYSLIVEPGTPMAARVARGEAVIPEDEAVNAMQRTAIGLLAGHGYARYEISNYAVPGYESRHNMTYWLRGDYLGLGCAAHSMMCESRFENPATLDGYLASCELPDIEKLTEDDAMQETVMLSTRTARGIDLNAWRARFGVDFETGREKTIARLRDAGYIIVENNALRLTQKGFEVQNAVVLELLTD